MQMKIDKFTNVKKAMDDMVFALKKEQADEVKQKDFCVEEFRKNQLQTEDKTRPDAQRFLLTLTVTHVTHHFCSGS
ncbi:unnamed protein product [Cladocopium goreaui]|uniref:Uncharacterized protein n=1 Tax=Cladocopium goreaui TaxID=2562237 RepID=A0A9P1D8H0_9DINO|nr:unnamed protein product [Cladocopium goreaui]